MSQSSSVHAQVARDLLEILEERRVVVWYDPRQDLTSVFDGLESSGLVKVDARPSLLKARRLADRQWTVLANTTGTQPNPGRLLIYVPWARAATDEARVQEPFEAYVRLGADFGVDPAQSLQAMARKALPQRAEEIDRLYAEHRLVTLEQLEALAERASFPLLKQALGTEDAIEVGVRIMGAPAQVRKALAAAGVQSDLVRLLDESFGFESPADPSMLRSAFIRWVLFSEFAFDIEDRVPEHTAQVPRASAPYQRAVYDVCSRLRGADEWRETYLTIADDVERTLKLGGISGETSAWGERDTFRVEDHAALRFVQAECMAGRLDSARKTLDLRKRSIWLNDPVRSQLWMLAGRALELLEATHAWENRKVAAARPVTEHVLAYTSESDGLWRVDRCQRWMERAAGDCVEREVLQPLFERTQAVYRQVVDAAQEAFLAAVARDGWPPAGPAQVGVFARHVAVRLQEGERVAYFLLDALRFEMGRDLGQMLEPLGLVQVEATATVVPTTTTFGMAALLPGAEKSFGCQVVNGELVPMVGGAVMATVEDRKERFSEQFGDRYVDLRLDTLIDANDAKLRGLIGRASLLVVRSDDIDKAGEGTNLPSARRFMSSILGDVKTVAQRLARVGVTRMVFAADHGYVLLPEVPPGDVLKAPAGEWLLSKRRCRLGKAIGAAEGVRVLPANQLNVHGPVTDVALATGFRVFTAGAAFFHEGVSPQECIVPTVSLEIRSARRDDGGSANVDVVYRSTRFSQRIFIVKLKFSNLLLPGVDVRVIAVSTNELGEVEQVGEAADCEARDPATGLIHLKTGVEEAVAIRIDDRFGGPDVEIQVLDAAGTGVVLGKKRLKNDCLD